MHQLFKTNRTQLFFQVVVNGMLPTSPSLLLGVSTQTHTSQTKHLECKSSRVLTNIVRASLQINTENKILRPHLVNRIHLKSPKDCIQRNTLPIEAKDAIPRTSSQKEHSSRPRQRKPTIRDQESLRVPPTICSANPV